MGYGIFFVLSDVPSLYRTATTHRRFPRRVPETPPPPPPLFLPRSRRPRRNAPRPRSARLPQKPGRPIPSLTGHRRPDQRLPPKWTILSTSPGRRLPLVAPTGTATVLRTFRHLSRYLLPYRFGVFLGSVVDPDPEKSIPDPK